jgi:predicted alpha/beta superfamily hydrolase
VTRELAPQISADTSLHEEESEKSVFEQPLFAGVKRIAAACCLAFASVAPVHPKPISTPITIGQTHTITSNALNEKRQINVYLPPEYADKKTRFPVLYLIDGGLDQDFLHIVGTTQLGAIWGRSQPVIVVGIATKDRRKELAGPTSDPELLKRYPTAGRSADFRRFVADEVKPMIAARYRTNGDDGVLGESMAGLFIVETWLRQPSLFKRYAAISPSLWWDKESLRQSSVALLAGKSAPRPPMLIATENEGQELADIAARFMANLPTDGTVCHAPQSFNHANIYHSVSPMALQFLFPPAQAPEPSFGFEVPCSKKS